MVYKWYINYIDINVVNFELWLVIRFKNGNHVHISIYRVFCVIWTIYV